MVPGCEHTQVEVMQDLETGMLYVTKTSGLLYVTKTSNHKLGYM